MTQVKIFQVKETKPESIQDQINTFLQENDGKIELVDIKYTSDLLNPGNQTNLRGWTAMIIYNTK